jgi:hypothetical protein
MRNKFDYGGKCLKQGTEAEDLFLKVGLNRDLKIRPATRKEQFKHIDYWIETEKGEYSVDVKAMKKINRGDSSAQDELCWIEIRGVRKNGSSWLVDGLANYIAFEREDHYILVDRLELLELVSKICNLSTFVSSSKDALYKSYRRKERPDEHLTIIKFEDMLKIKHRIWEKSS